MLYEFRFGVCTIEGDGASTYLLRLFGATVHTFRERYICWCCYGSSSQPSYVDCMNSCAAFIISCVQRHCEHYLVEAVLARSFVRSVRSARSQSSENQHSVISIPSRFAISVCACLLFHSNCTQYTHNTQQQHSIFHHFHSIPYSIRFILSRYSAEL